MRILGKMNYYSFLKAKNEGRLPKPLEKISFDDFISRIILGGSAWFTYEGSTFLISHSPNIGGYIIDDEKIPDKIYIRKKEDKLNKQHFMPSLDYCIKRFNINGKNFKYIIEHATNICFILYL